MSQYLIFALACAVAALLYGVFSIKWVLAQPSGQRAHARDRGGDPAGRAGLSQSPVHDDRASSASILFVVLGFALDWPTAFGFLVGAILSGVAGYTGMYISVRANVRTAEAARNGINAALKIAFRGGAITGMLVVGFGLLGVVGYYWIATELYGAEKALHALVGFAFGGSLISIFARLGGGIFTKGADVGADLVGKVEAGIPEDDPRNPAVIADNVGDNVGDCAGHGGRPLRDLRRDDHRHDAARRSHLHPRARIPRSRRSPATPSSIRSSSAAPRSSPRSSARSS